MSSDRVIAASETLAMINSKLTSEDDLQSDGWIPVSLLCPLALTRIEIPVRSVNCDHLQCFDLSSYLTINKRRPRWSCPVCSSPAPFRDLRRDDFFVQLIADESLKDAEMVHVDANGHWLKASKPTESDSSAAVAAKGSISGIPSDNSTTVAVPSQLDETSTVSPCILESDFSSRSVAPIDTDVSQSSDCVVHLDDGDDDNYKEGDTTQPEQPTFAHPTSLNDCCTPSPPAAVTDEQPTERPSAALDSAPTKVSKCEEDVGVCHTTAVEWYAICRSVCSAALMRETGQIGGPGVEVHIDKTLINRRNYNVGGRWRRWWLVGMYDTKRKKALFEQVNDRSWTALISVIRSAVEGAVVGEEKFVNSGCGYARSGVHPSLIKEVAVRTVGDVDPGVFVTVDVHQHGREHKIEDGGRKTHPCFTPLVTASASETAPLSVTRAIMSS
nr:unnamed protein product [Spirometra erinaceieuropaei]